MSRPLVSVVLCTYHRAHLLRRSLECYERSVGIDPQADLELVVVDDHSADGTRDLVIDWSHRTGIKSVVLTPSPKPEAWRDCGAILNVGIRASSGEHVILTHPEVMPGKRSVAACVEALVEFEGARRHRTGWENGGPLGLYACCTPYYLSPRDQERIDTVPWREQGAGAVTQIADFYDEGPGGNPSYRHNATEKVGSPGYRERTWESWVFGGCSRETWKRLGGMLETSKWGSVDIAFMRRRQTLGIPNHTCVGPDTMCVHQNHDLPGNVPTPRIEQVWKDELKDVDLQTPSKLVYPHCDYLGWGS